MRRAGAFGLASGFELATNACQVVTDRSISSSMDDELERLYRRYGPAIYAHCRSMLKDDAAAEDALHETFIRVQRHLARAVDAREALYFIHRVATNVCLNEIRNRKRRAAPVDVLPELGELVDPADHDAVTRLFGNAHEKLRDVAWLHFVEGLDQHEVARTLDISRGTVVTRLQRFRAAARKLLGGPT